MSKMKILEVSLYYKPLWNAGGPARIVYELSTHLAKDGHKVTVFTTNYRDHEEACNSVDIDKPCIVDGILVYYFNNHKNLLKSNVFIPLPISALSVASSSVGTYDVIHIHEHRTLLAIIVSHYAIKNKIPYVVQAHGSVLPFYKKISAKKIFDFLWGAKILRNASFLIVHSMQMKQINI